MAGQAAQLTPPTGKDKGGAFSERIDKTSSRVGEVNVTRSLIGQLQTVPGVAPFTFDYHEHSGRWVSDPPSIGPALGDAIDCLFDRSGSEKVIVVAHSMGGLATRYALGEDRDRADKVSTVVTFGTPPILGRSLHSSSVRQPMLPRSAAKLGGQ